MAWYKCKKSSGVKLVPWSTGSVEDIKAMVDAYYAGELSLSDIQSVWSVGDERAVFVDNLANVTFVIMNWGGKTLDDGNDTECLAVVGQKNCLNSKRYINSNLVYFGWSQCQTRTWLNNTYKNNFPEDLLTVFKPFKSITGEKVDYISQTVTAIDYFALPSKKEVFGTSANTSENSDVQFEFYETASNRIKMNKDSNGAETTWYLRSCNLTSNNPEIGYVNVSGSMLWTASKSAKHDIAPYGVI